MYDWCSVTQPRCPPSKGLRFYFCDLRQPVVLLIKKIFTLGHPKILFAFRAMIFSIQRYKTNKQDLSNSSNFEME